jgi:large subunit ribosomal protein L9e
MVQHCVLPLLLASRLQTCCGTKLLTINFFFHCITVEISVKNRVITVKGPRGTLTKDIKHIHLDIHQNKEARTLTVEAWHGDRMKNSQINLVCSLVQNLITGVQKGYRHKMKFVYAHFPVNCVISPDNKSIEIRNFLGEKYVRKVTMLDGVTVSLTGQKDEIQVEGNDLEKVSQSAANIHCATLVRNKDIREFLDGIYVHKKEHIVQEED